MSTAELVSAEVEASAETPTTLLLSREMLVEVDANGEVVGVLGAPGGSADVEEIAGWLGPRLKRTRAKLAGLEAEKKALLKEIEDHYGPLINRQKGTLRWLEGQYVQTLADYARAALAGAKTKSLRVGPLKIGFKLSGGGIEVLDERTAVQWAKLACPAAVKEGFLRSAVPDDIELSEEATGLRRIPVEDKFYLE